MNWSVSIHPFLITFFSSSSFLGMEWRRRGPMLELEQRFSYSWQRFYICTCSLLSWCDILWLDLLFSFADISPSLKPYLQWIVLGQWIFFDQKMPKRKTSGCLFVLMMTMMMMPMLKKKMIVITCQWWQVSNWILMSYQWHRVTSGWWWGWCQWCWWWLWCVFDCAEVSCGRTVFGTCWCSARCRLCSVVRCDTCLQDQRLCLGKSLTLLAVPLAVW